MAVPEAGNGGEGGQLPDLGRWLADPAPTGSMSSTAQGYEFQDVMAAGLLAVGVLEGFTQLAAEAPRDHDTGFDDVELTDGAVRRRWQLKHSVDPTKRLTAAELRGSSGQLRLKKLAESAAGAQTADEYRVLITWSEPASDDPHLTALLIPDHAAPTLPGLSTRRYRLDPEVIWPADADAPASWLGADAGLLRRADILDLCAHSVWEFGAPPTSDDVYEPGPGETWLIDYLEQKWGLGRFPNETLDPVAAADALVRIAARARSRAAYVTAPQLLSQLRVSVDYGRLRQISPVDAQLAVGRDTAVDELIDDLAPGKALVVSAAPGSGKTWTVDQIAERCEADGLTVARHYCYLTPDDTHVDERIKGDRMFGNLLAGLLNADPSLGEHHQGFAADERELGRLLEANAGRDGAAEILLIVDGLDHIDRVRARSTRLSHQDADLIERLAQLTLPPRVRLLVLSQPGPHLDPLGSAAERRQLARWNDGELETVAERSGLDGESAVADELRVAVVSRADGNPLYATYLSRQLSAALDEHPDADAEELLEQVPPVGEHLTDYYAALYEHATGAAPSAQLIINLLATVGLAVTRADLEAMLPALGNTVEQALDVLRPLLRSVGDANAVRVHHESFQRFVMARMAGDGISPRAVLGPALDWLEGLGLFADGRAFRHLIPVALRADEPARAVGYLQPDFVARSVQHGFSAQQVTDNLTLAAEAAAMTGDWAALTSIFELAKANANAFEDYTLAPFARPFVAAAGPAAAADRLQDEGQATWDRFGGLLLCSACDHAGGQPPWQLYLDMPAPPPDPLNRSLSDDDLIELANRAWAHGRLRTAGADATQEAQRLLERAGDDHQLSRAIMERLRWVAGTDAVETIMPELDGGPIRQAALLELAIGQRDAGAAELAAQTAGGAVSEAGGLLSWAYEGLDLGGRADQLAAEPDVLAEQATRISPVDPRDATEDLRRWILHVRVLGACDPSSLKAVRDAVTGTDWYQDWLRFAVDEAAATSSDDRLRALRLLAGRASSRTQAVGPMDLYTVAADVNASIRRAATKLSDEDWTAAVPSLVDLSRRTGGTFNLSSFADLLGASAASRPGAAQLIDSQMALRTHDAVYGDLAELEVQRGLAHLAVGDTEGLSDAWKRACEYRAGYGYRKDMTLFELIESVPALAAHDLERARERAHRLQRLSDLVVAHTDGDHTRHAPMGWFDELAPLAPAIAADALGEAISWEGGDAGSALQDRGVQRVLRAAAPNADPVLEQALWSTVSYVRYQLDDRLAALDRLAGHDAHAAAQACRLLHAAADGDPQHPQPDDVARIVDWATRHAVELEAASDIPATRPASEHRSPATSGRRSSSWALEPSFQLGMGSGVLVEGIRRTARSRPALEGGDWSAFVNALGYRLVELAAGGETARAARMLFEFAHDSRLWRDPDPLAALGEGLKRHEQPALAAHAFALGWVHASSGGGWRRTGGADHAGLLERARELDAEAADDVLAVELARAVSDESGPWGFTRGLVDVFAAVGLADRAFDTWDAAMAVIENRLPETGLESRFFPQLPDHSQTPPPLDEALARLLGARTRNPDAASSRNALAGMRQFARHSPALAAVALEQVLRCDSTDLQLQAALEAAFAADDPAPFRSRLGDELELLARHGSFVVRRRAAQLLGAPVPPGRRSPAAAVAVPRLTQPAEQVARVRSIDRLGRLRGLAGRVHPDIPERVAATFTALWDRPRGTFPAPVADRSRMAHSPAHEDLPYADIRMWHEELFEIALGETMAAAERGATRDEIAYAVATMNLDIDLTCLLQTSRSPRPLALPGHGDAPEPLLDGPFAGWWRVAYIEDELVPDTTSYRDLKSVRTTRAALAQPSAPVPMVPSALGSWHAAGRHHGTPAEPAPAGVALIDFDLRPTPFGTRQAIMLAPALASHLPLRADDAVGMRLLDSNGNPAVMLRRWWVRPLGEYAPEALLPRYAGAELLLRQDVFGELEGLVDEPLRWKLETDEQETPG